AARVHAPRVRRGVLGRVPALDREVDAAGERERIVDTDQLLMVGGAERMAPIEAKVNARMRLPGAVEQLLDRAARAVHDRDVPDQKIDVEIRGALDQRG